MSKPTSKKVKPSEGKVFVYNRTTRLLGCLLESAKAPDGAHRPPVQIDFVPGNNEIDVDIWERCKQVRAFKHMLVKGKHPVGGGKWDEYTPLIEGKYDKGQDAEEAELIKKLEEARRKASA